jgi:nucleotide-binding universal stress UspA family protein
VSDRVIVVGVDGSQASLAALRWALHEAALRQVDLRVVGVVDIRMQPMVPLGDKLGTDLMDAMVRQVEDVIDKVKDDASAVDIEQDVRAGHPSSQLIDLSKDAELLVVGRRGHSALAGLIMGSVATQVSAHADCPVVVVHESR